jgi:citrate lyase subunit beta / citryl-CoA lyase
VDPNYRQHINASIAATASTERAVQPEQDHSQLRDRQLPFPHDHRSRCNSFSTLDTLHTALYYRERAAQHCAAAPPCNHAAQRPSRLGDAVVLYRSFLFAPGNHPRRVEKAFSLDADAVILDLEDACPVAEKVATRSTVVAACQSRRTCLGYVRVNATSTEYGYGDIVAVVHTGLDGIVLPKVETADEIKAVDWVMTNLEKERSLPIGAVDVIPIIETGKGMANIRAITAASTRVKRIAFGAGDFTLDMNMEWSRSEIELFAYRSECVLASRAAEIEPPIDTVWTDLKDAIGFTDSVRQIRSLGFQGKMCIHPEQVPIANAVLSPSAEQIDWSRRVVEAFETAEAAGSASIQLAGKFIDYPIVHRARRVLATAQRVAARSK